MSIYSLSPLLASRHRGDLCSTCGVGCSNYFVPIHTKSYVQQKTLGVGVGDFPITERIAGRTIALAFFSKI